MRQRLIGFLKRHPFCVRLAWGSARVFLSLCGLFIRIEPKRMLFASFGGRKFDDCPKAIYDEICSRPEFDSWELIWAFAEPEKFTPPRGRKIKIDTPEFFHTLLSSRVWVSNSGMDRGIGLKPRGILRVETWHGTPLKKIGGEENQNSIGGKKNHRPGALDKDTIRCAQSEYDKAIFQRIFKAAPESFLLCDLPRNDKLLAYSPDELLEIRRQLAIPEGKKVLLYTPTYREYLLDEQKQTYLAPPIDMVKWERALGGEYILLFRAHYAVNKAMGIRDTDFIRDVSDYPRLNDLYAVADIMISDYSSTFFDFSILDRPMFCFAYDLEEYEQKRGLYLDLEETMPCPVDRDEDSLLEHILNMDIRSCVEGVKAFHRRFAPYAGSASKAVTDKILSEISEK